MNNKRVIGLGQLSYKRIDGYPDYYYLFDISSIIHCRYDTKLFYEQFASSHVHEEQGKYLISDRAMMKWITINDGVLSDEERQSLYHAFMDILSSKTRTEKKKLIMNDSQNLSSMNTIDEYVEWKIALSQKDPIHERINKVKNPFLYVDRFLLKTKLHSLLQYRVFPNIKEITESMASYYAVKTCLEQTGLGRDKFGDLNTNCYVIADGSTPRTGCIFVQSTNWRIFSIDPVMKTNSGAATKYNRLSCHQCTAEEFEIPCKNVDLTESALSVVVAVHSHANFNAFWQRLPNPKIGVAIPCCVEQFCDGLACLLEYDDNHILSAANHIKLWYQAKK